MPDDFSHMDEWQSDEVARFKDEAKNKAVERMLSRTLVPTAETAFQKIVAEGDSWFNYPLGIDIIDCLRGNHDYMINNYAKPGDTLENMIYGTDIINQFERVSPTIERVLERLER